MQEMNFLLKFAHPSHGAEPTTLVILYKVRLLSRLHYKAVAYSNASSTSLLTSLNMIHDIVLKLVSIACLTCLSVSVLVYLGEIPLSLCY